MDAEGGREWTQLESPEGPGSQIEIQVKYNEWNIEEKRQRIKWWPIPKHYTKCIFHYTNDTEDFCYVYDWEYEGYGTMVIDGQMTNSSRYLVNLRNMTHLNIDTKTSREIRYFRAPFLLTKSKWCISAKHQPQNEEDPSEIYIYEGEEEPTEKPDVQIDVDYGDYWWTLPAKATKAIVDGMCTGHFRFPYSYAYLRKQGTWVHEGKRTTTSRYTINTSKMTQKNRDNETSREIRFRLGPFLVTKCGWSIVDSTDRAKTQEL